MQFARGAVITKRDRVASAASSWIFGCEAAQDGSSQRGEPGSKVVVGPSVKVVLQAMGQCRDRREQVFDRAALVAHHIEAVGCLLGGNAVVEDPLAGVGRDQRHRGRRVRFREPEFGGEFGQAPIRLMRRQGPSRLGRERYHGVAIDAGHHKVAGQHHRVVRVSVVEQRPGLFDPEPVKKAVLHQLQASPPATLMIWLGGQRRSGHCMIIDGL